MIFQYVFNDGCFILRKSFGEVYLRTFNAVAVSKRNNGDGLPPGTGNGGCNRSDGLPPVPGTPSQQGSRSQGSGMDGQTPEANTMPQQQQQPQQQQTNVSQNAQGFASTTNLDASGQGYPVQGCQQGNMPVMQGQGPEWFGAQWIPQQHATECASACT